MSLTPDCSTPVPDWLCQLRRAASDALETIPQPNRESEMWRYAPIEHLDLDRYLENVLDNIAGDEREAIRALQEGNNSPEHLARGLATAYSRLMPRTEELAKVIVTHNGVVVHIGENNSRIDDAIAVKQAISSEEPCHFGDFPPLLGTYEDRYFSTLNTLAAPDPIIIDVQKDANIELPIVILHWFDGAGSAAFPRTLARIGESSRVTFGEYFVSPTDIDGLLAPVTQIDLADNAQCGYAAVQDLGAGATIIASQQNRVGADARFSSTTTAFGASFSRFVNDCRLIGKGGESILRAMYFGSKSQVLDFRTMQDHRAPHTTSDLLFKGAVGEHANSIYSGLIRVEKGARGTSAFQTNRNLVLSDGAHADSVPNLEIEENDVRCSHASAVGPIDDDQLYYLESRGVPTDIAKRLIVIGFFDELAQDLPVEAWRAQVRARVVAKFDMLAKHGNQV